MVDPKKVAEINKLAKTLKDTGVAPSMDDAVKMAERMVADEEKSIEDMQEKEEAEEGFKGKVGNVVEDIREAGEDAIERVEKALHITVKKDEETKTLKKQEKTEEVEEE